MSKIYVQKKPVCPLSLSLGPFWWAFVSCWKAGSIAQQQHKLCSSLTQVVTGYCDLPTALEGLIHGEMYYFEELSFFFGNT